MSRLFVCIAAIFASLSAINAEEDSGIISSTEKFTIYYRFDRSDIDETYLDNSRAIEGIKTLILTPPPAN